MFPDTFILLYRLGSWSLFSFYFYFVCDFVEVSEFPSLGFYSSDARCKLDATTRTSQNLPCIVFH